MAKPKKPTQTAAMAESVSPPIAEVVSVDAPQTDAPQTDAPKTPKIVIDGAEYDATNLSGPAKGAIASLQFAEAKLMALQNELAICQTAHFAYVKALKAELEGAAN
jgi:hypothetical protein